MHYFSLSFQRNSEKKIASFIEVNEEKAIVAAAITETPTINSQLTDKAYKRKLDRLHIDYAKYKNLGPTSDASIIVDFIKKGFGQAAYDYAMYFYDNDEIDSAILYLKKAVTSTYMLEKSRGIAAEELAQILKSQKRYSEALEYYQLSANTGNAVAYCCMARMYQDELLGEPDYQKIKMLYEKSAELGEPYAQFTLAHIYSPPFEEKNKNFSEFSDPDKAIFWLKKATDQKHLGAIYTLAGFYAAGNHVERDYDRAFNFYHYITTASLSPAEKNNFKNEIFSSYYELGILYMKGRGCAVNLEMAAYCFKKAAKSNDIDACYMAGLVYTKHLSEHPDSETYREGLKWFEVAASNNDIDAIFELIRHYLFVDKNKKKFAANLKIVHSHLCALGKFKAEKKLKPGRECDLLYIQYYYNDIIITALNKNKNNSCNHHNQDYADKLANFHRTQKIGLDNLLAAAKRKQYPMLNFVVFAEMELCKLHFSKDSQFFDEALGFKYLIDAANNGHMKAQYQLARIYLGKHSFSFGNNYCDVNQALFYLQKAANQGYYKANSLLIKTKNIFKEKNPQEKNSFIEDSNNKSEKNSHDDASINAVEATVPVALTFSNELSENKSFFCKAYPKAHKTAKQLQFFSKKKIPTIQLDTKKIAKNLDTPISWFNGHFSSSNPRACHQLN